MNAALLLWLPWSIVTLIMIWFEVARIRAVEAASPGQLRWLTEWDSEVTLPLLVLLALPILMKVAGPYAGWKTATRKPQSAEEARNVPQTATPRPAYRATRRQLISGALLSALASGIASLSIGMQTVTFQGISSSQTMRLEQLPPTYHDEFSYLLQAQTFLAGRWSWPAHDRSPDLFHQVHVLDAPTTASRYFPWTGLWLSPWLAIGHPFWGYWCAGAITAALFYLSAVQILDHRPALGVGVLVGVSPGMAVFSNLLLAHHPTIMALSLFLWAYLRLLQSHQVRFAAVSGIGLTLAMLGRPMTAAGFSLPCGLWLAVELLRMARTSSTRAIAGRIVVAYALPLALGFTTLAIQNNAITGDWLTSPYQLYTDTWTPRHRYGFHNVSAAPPPLTTSEVMRPYDEWASELTFASALQNVWKRLFASLLWTLGIAPILLGTIALMVAGLLTIGGRSGCCGPKSGTADLPEPVIAIPFACIISMHVAHLPYWYAGILDWHYVFETGPLLILVTMAGLTIVSRFIAREIGGVRSFLWLTSLVLSVLIPGWFSVESMWGDSKVAMALDNQTYSRVRMAQFNELKASESLQRPCLILVDERGENPQLSFVINPPELNADVLVCRRPTKNEGLDDLRQQFPDRVLYEFDPTGFLLTKISDH